MLTRDKRLIRKTRRAECKSTVKMIEQRDWKQKMTKNLESKDDHMQENKIYETRKWNLKKSN